MLSCCKLCPRMCGVNRENGEMGFCGAGSKIKIARSALHFWEEPCISGENGSGTVFFSCCNMKCVYCQNFEISTLNKGKSLSEEELSEEFLKLQSLGANNINLVTPTHFVPQIISSVDMAREKGLNLPIVYNCGGYENVDTIKLLEGYVDIYMPDMKYFSDKYAVKYSNAPDYFRVAASAISEMQRQVGSPVLDENGIMKNGVIVRHMMLPGLMSETKKILDYLSSAYGDDIYISLMSQYTPLEHVKNIPSLNKKVKNSVYSAMVEYALSLGIKNAFIQDGDSAAESFIPDFCMKD